MPPSLSRAVLSSRSAPVRASRRSRAPLVPWRAPPHLGWLLLLGPLTIGCARREPAAYATAEAAASRAYVHGRYEEAAAHWLAAAAAARHARDADEARYRAAKSLERADRDDDAAKLLDDLAATEGSDRAARAAFDRAELELDAGHEAEGIALRDHALRTFPSSGLATRALQRQLAWHRDRQGVAGALAYLTRLAGKLGETELAEALAYERANLLTETDDDAAALAAYLECAERFPYPYGVYWDDALYRAAELERALGRPRAAIAHLERMLASREPRPQLTGSLERPRFGAARFLIAVTLRDDLGDTERARREFLRLVREHATSRLRDDALWAAAELAWRAGNQRAACADARRLARDFPASRYVGCLGRLCPAAADEAARCPAYLGEPEGD